MTVLRAAVAVLAILLLAPASAHGPPAPRDLETRLLTDQNDDCEDQPGNQCRGGSHELIALSVREAWQDGHVLVFSLWMDHGAAGAKRDVISLDAAGSRQSIELTTTDDQRFTSSKGQASGPYPLKNADGSNDGTRFGVDITVSREALGLGAGDRISGFRVEAHNDDTLGDFMPGTSQTAVGPAPKGRSEQSDPVETVKQSHTLRGPVQYLRLDAQTDVQVPVDDTSFVGLDLENLLGDMAQRVSLSATGGNGVRAGFHVPGSDDDRYPATMQVDLAARGSHFVHLALTGTTEGSGTVTVVATTDKGGRVTDDVAYEVSADAAPAPTPEPTPTTATKDSPMPSALALVALAGTLAMRHRP